MEQKLQELIDSLNASKFEETFRLESIDPDSHILKTTLENPIQLNPKRHYNAGLWYFTVFNYIINIDSTNNIFKYSNDRGTSWHTIELLTGSYTVDKLDKEIKRQMKLKGHHNATNDTAYINLLTKPENNRLVLEITNETYLVDRKVTRSVTSFLGFKLNPSPLSKGYHIADKSAVISEVYTIDLRCNIIRGGFVKGKQRQIIYDIPSFTVPITAKIIEQPQVINYFPLSTNYIDEITIELLDQDGRPLNIPGERKFASIKIVQV